MRATAAAGYVYIAALSNGTVKVGRSQDADRRLGAHKRNARTLGLTVVDSWTSPLHAEWLSNEDALKRIAADLGGVPEGREAFSGIEFAAVVDKARDLTFTAPAAPAPEAPEHGGCLTPRERMLALTAMQTGMSDVEKADLFGGGLLRLLAVISALDDGMTLDDLHRLSPGKWDPGVDAMIRAMKALTSFEHRIEGVTAKKEAAMEALFERASTKAA